jgi:hypothetical protein
VEGEKGEKGMVKSHSFFDAILKKAEFKGKLSVVDARKESNELSGTILPESCLSGKRSSGERKYWGTQ